MVATAVSLVSGVVVFGFLQTADGNLRDRSSYLPAGTEVSAVASIIGARHNLRLDFRDERSGKDADRLRSAVILDGTTLWEDFAKLEEAVGSAVLWAGGTHDAERPAWIARITDESSKTTRYSAAEGEFRLFIEEDAFDSKVANVRLEWTPNVSVVSAVWRPSTGAKNRADEEAVFDGFALLGRTHARRRDELSGAIELRVGTRWETFDIEARRGASKSFTARNVSEIVVQSVEILRGVDRTGDAPCLRAAIGIAVRANHVSSQIFKEYPLLVVPGKGSVPWCRHDGFSQQKGNPGLRVSRFEFESQIVSQSLDECSVRMIVATDAEDKRLSIQQMKVLTDRLATE